MQQEHPVVNRHIDCCRVENNKLNVFHAKNAAKFPAANTPIHACIKWHLVTSITIPSVCRRLDVMVSV